MRCPDCDGVADILSIYGNGKCSYCHGSGDDHSILDEITETDSPRCYKCGGSGTCQTCHGSGEVE